jgi:CheY-like chemotaxis protein
MCKATTEPTSQNRRILLVDDDHDILRGACLRLRAAGYETMAVNNGVQAVAAAIENRPDAIVLDVRMPGKDGLSALGELQDGNVTRDIPVVMLSASVVDEKRSLDAGARYFLRKPYRGTDLLAALTAALSSSTPLPRD